MSAQKKPRLAKRKPSDDGDEPTPDPNPPIPGPAGGPFVSSLTIDPFVVTGAGGPLYQATGIITLNAPAPAGGAIVNISFSQPDLVRVWNTVLPLKVPKGKTKIKFLLQTSAVPVLTTVEISANRSPFDIHKATLYILPAALNYFVADHYFYHGEGGPVYGGERILIQAVLTGPAAIPYSVALHSSNNSILNLQGMQLDFSPGEYGKDLIVPTSLVTQETQVVITATFPSALGGGTASSSTSVQLAPVFLKGIHKQRVQAIDGEVIETSGHKYKWKFWLNGRAPVGGATVTFQSSDPSLLVADPSITIPEGSTDGHFHIWTDQSQYGGGQCGSGCYVHISGTYVHTVTRRFKVYDA